MKEQQRKTVDARIEKDKQKFLEILEKSPVVQVACERSGVSKATFYRWKDTDKEFSEKVAKALTEGNSLISDMAISQLISAIKEKNLGAIKFWLENHHEDYANKLHITAEIEQEMVLNPEQEALVRRALELVSQPKPPTYDHGI
jgi:hypothetical protein